MSGFSFLSIGHSNIRADRLVALLQGAGAAAIADVRTTPFSRFCPWFSGKKLAPFLEQHGIGYLPYGGQLGGRPQSADLYCDSVADYEAMARQDDFQAGLDRLAADAVRLREHGHVCLMCAEREPLDCHRCLLVARALKDRGFAVGHVLHDGSIEPHADTEQRLLMLAGDADDLFASGQNDRIAAAYRRRAGAVAYRSGVGKRTLGARTREVSR